jgi:hypothetical protein
VTDGWHERSRIMDGFGENGGILGLKGIGAPSK